MDGFINNLNKNNLNTVSLILIQVYLLRTGLVKNYLLFEFQKNWLASPFLKEDVLFKKIGGKAFYLFV